MNESLFVNLSEYHSNLDESDQNGPTNKSMSIQSKF